jgi:hypothetical protein
MFLNRVSGREERRRIHLSALMTQKCLLFFNLRLSAFICGWVFFLSVIQEILSEQDVIPAAETI